MGEVELPWEADFGEEHLAAVARVGGGGERGWGGWGCGWEGAMEAVVGGELGFKGGDAGTEGEVFF